MDSQYIMNRLEKLIIKSKQRRILLNDKLENIYIKKKGTVNRESKMADTVKPLVESALNKLLEITEKSGNLRRDLRRNITDSKYSKKHFF
jgi:hypothetical protein